MVQASRLVGAEATSSLSLDTYNVWIGAPLCIIPDSFDYQETETSRMASMNARNLLVTITTVAAEDCLSGTSRDPILAILVSCLTIWHMQCTSCRARPWIELEDSILTSSLDQTTSTTWTDLSTMHSFFQGKFTAQRTEYVVFLEQTIRGWCSTRHARDTSLISCRC